MKPNWRLTVAGRDISATARPRLSRLTLTEKRGDEADELEIVLTDEDGKLAFPSPGAAMTLAIGLGDDLVEKGRFTVDEFEWSGPVDVLTIRAHAADFTADLSTRRDRSWRDTTLGQVIDAVAGPAGLQPRVDPDLASIALSLVAQSRDSDLALLRRLGREHDAVATVKNGRLLFARIGRGRTASGAQIPGFTLTRRSGDRFTWRAAERDAGGTGASSTRANAEPAGVRARWRDVAGGATKTVLVGRARGARTLPRIYATENQAQRAAQAAHDRRARKKAVFSIALAEPAPSLYPERRVTLQGFKPAIDAATWLVEEVVHTMDDNALATALTLESTA
ncbi:contractile injection system protein, VgrG/Pvc8 family [Brevundimonas nasdae]|uniref:contractile injection system protein, VgrG/Pvc8 family n=1 Tax=Brevundimonas nasdae TaxID=172043 RepID=UPI003F6947FF